MSGAGTMLRAAIYARYSTDQQNERSISDQVALCRIYADRHGLSVVSTYDDKALSGASLHGRAGIRKLLADAREKSFDAVLVESTSRLARDQEDLHFIIKRLHFLDVVVITASDGVVTPMVAGLRGIIDSQYRTDLVLSIRRGMQGRVREGRIAGGICYGYRVLKETDSAGEPIRGLRSIDEREAAIVRKIFRDTVFGMSAPAIATALNRERVPSPAGRDWSGSTINGSRKRGNGILRQELYVGRLVWNRARMLKNPDTGKRVPRQNDSGEHIFSEVPHLRIVDDETWNAVQKILEEKGGTQSPHRRFSPHLFSGLVKCGSCDASFISIGKNGKRSARVACRGRRERGNCENSRTVSIALIEDLVLKAIENDLLSEKVIAAVVREYSEERRRLRSQREKCEHNSKHRLRAVESAIKGLMTLAEESTDPASLGPRLRELEEEHRTLLAEGEATAAEVIEIRPDVAGRYRDLVRDLRRKLAARPASRKAEVVSEIRGLVDKIAIFPAGDPAGRDIELTGQLGLIAAGPQGFPHAGGQLVAEDRFRASPRPSLTIRIAVCSRKTAA